MAATNIPLSNGKSFTAAQAKISFGAVPVQSITAFEAGVEQDSEMLYGMGPWPTEVAEDGQYTNLQGKMTLYKTEVEALRQSSPNGLLVGLPIADAVVVWLNGTRVITETCHNCKITSDKLTVKKGDKGIEYEVPFIFSHMTRV